MDDKGQQWFFRGTVKKREIGLMLGWEQRGQGDKGARGILTTCAPRTHGAIARTVGVATNIPHSRIN